MSERNVTLPKRTTWDGEPQRYSVESSMFDGEWRYYIFDNERRCALFPGSDLTQDGRYYPSEFAAQMHCAALNSSA